MPARRSARSRSRGVARRSTPAWLVVVATLGAATVAGLAGCGDNLDAPVTTRCEPTPPEPPPSGPFADPLSLPLPDSCIVGGLDQLVGRWFVRDPDRSFLFHYPKFEGNCSDGFRRANWIDDDHDDTDSGTFYTWSDGTRIYYRDHVRIEFQGGVFEYADAFAACRVPGGKLAAVSAKYDTDRGSRTFPMTGTRFQPKDTIAKGLSLLGEVGAGTISGYNLAVDGNHAFVVGPRGLHVVDITNASGPSIVGHIEGEFNDVKLVRAAGRLVAYAAPINGDRTAIVDVTNPSQPMFVGSIPEYSHSLFVVPTPTPRLYLANYTDTVPVFDVSAPLTPVLTARIPIPGSGPEAGIHDIHVNGNRVYAMKTTDGVVAVDVTTGLATPTLIGGLPTTYSHAGWHGTVGGQELFIHGDEGLTPDGGAFLRVLDADAASATVMTELGRYASRPEVGIHNMEIVGDRAYIAYYQDGVRIVDLTNARRPVEIAHYNTWNEATAPGSGFEGAVGIVIVGTKIYLADFARGLVILEAPP